MPTRFLATLCVCVVLATPAAAQPAADCELGVVLEGGDVYDGRGSEPVATDVGILDDRVAALGDLSGCTAARRLDVTGLAVVPGFIDIHSHGTRGVFRYPLAENLIRQGVTSVIGGPDGSSPYPIGDYLARLDELSPAVNFGLMVGYGTVRREVMGNADRAPTAAELAAMKAMVGRAMSEGAFGLSSGLKYVPGVYAETEEVVELARIAGSSDGIYISHMREEGVQLLDAVRETIRVGEEGGLPTQITHHKVLGAPMWGRSTDSLALVDDARARGIDVTSDQYPYTASSTGLSILFPAWSLEGSREELLARLDDPDQRARIKVGIVATLRDDRGGNDPDNVVIARCAWDATLDGMSLADVLTVQDREVDLVTAAELVRRRVRVASTTPARAALPHPTVGSAHPPTPGPPPGHDTCPRPASDDRIPIDGYRCGFVQPVFCLPSRRWSVGLTPAPSRRGATQKTLCAFATTSPRRPVAIVIRRQNWVRTAPEVTATWRERSRRIPAGSTPEDETRSALQGNRRH